jgi:hypothetical protein
MSEEAKPRNWWHTLPGVLTGVAAVVTALAGLLAALMQTGWVGGSKPTPAPQAAGSTPPAPAAAAPAATLETPRTAPRASEAPRAHAVALPAQRDYKLGPAVFKATFTLLKAEVVPQTAEKSALHIRLRMTNHDRNDKNFWDRSFRLLVDGVPVAPEGGLNELVPGDAAKEGEVIFPIPRGTASGTLRITYYDNSTDIPLTLAP